MPFEGWILFVAAFVVVPYLLAPIFIWLHLTFKARAPIDLLQPAESPPQVYDHFAETGVGLRACGFTVANYLRIRDQVSNATAYIAKWICRPAGQAATAVVIVAQPKNGPQRITKYVEFTTELPDGREICTNNCGAPGALATPPENDTLYASGVASLQDLYCLHQSREARLFPTTETRFLPNDGEEMITTFAEGLEAVYRWQVRVGFMRETAAPGVYRYTLSGAFKGTWRQLPPLKQILAWRMQRRVKAELREAEVRPPTPPTNIRVSNVSPYRQAS
jgi:hypothetical protein